MPVALISTRNSPALGPSRSTSTISSGFLASKATAARVFISSLQNHAVVRLLLEPALTSVAVLIYRQIQDVMFAKSERRAGSPLAQLLHLRPCSIFKA